MVKGTTCPRTTPGRGFRGPIVLLILLALWACGEPVSETSRVVRVFDGDSFIVASADGRQTEVRLFGIDAPERHQPWSRRSREALRSLVRDREVLLEEVTVDGYGRTVAVVRRYSDGLEVNREMIRLGHAWVYRRYTTDPTLIDLERRARDAGIGLWSLPEAERMPPWQWRSQNRRSRERE